MMRRPPRFLALALLLLPFAGAACGSGSGGGAAAPSGPGAVNVVDNKFDPGTIEIAAGDTVTWTFKGKAAHNVTGPGFRSKTTKKLTFTHTFDSAGEFPYTCTIHPGMTGKVKVS
jgi:plastocyanin